jgi:hypothetical protein
MSGESSLAQQSLLDSLQAPNAGVFKNNNGAILRSHAILLATASATTYGGVPLIKPSTSTTALAKAGGASCGRLCPIPP